MAKKSGFFNSINGDRKYLATDISEAFDIGITTGLKADNADNYKIVPNVNMQVKMLPGGAIIFGNYSKDPDEELINLDPAHAELNRIDRIVLRYDKFERSIKSAVIKGTAALTPTAPAALRTNEQFDLVLADVYIGKAVTSISADNITDMRESELCGYIGVKGAVSQIDFDAHIEESAKKHIGESGQNINGHYIKFDDGTLVAYLTKHINVSGSQYYSGTSEVFPAQFYYDEIAGIVPSIQVTGYSTQHHVGNANGYTKTTGAALGHINYRWGVEFPQPLTSGKAIINIAITGRWKAYD